MNLLADAIQRAGTIDKDVFARAIASTEAFRGVTGEISYRKPQRPPLKPVAIIGVTKGEVHAVETWRP